MQKLYELLKHHKVSFSAMFTFAKAPFPGVTDAAVVATMAIP